MRAYHIAEDPIVIILTPIANAISNTFDALLWLLGERGEG